MTYNGILFIREKQFTDFETTLIIIVMMHRYIPLYEWTAAGSLLRTV